MPFFRIHQLYTRKKEKRNENLRKFQRKNQLLGWNLRREKIFNCSVFCKY